MSREILINTPENIAVEYELAGLGTRFCANIADTFLQVLIYGGIYLVTFLVIICLMFVAATLHWHSVSRILEEMTGFVFAASIILGFLVAFGYYIYYENKWNGQTPGKRYVGLRVIREGGYPVDPYSVIIRNLMRIVDFLPFVYFAGITSILFSTRYQRLGDLVSGTIVVKQRAPKNLINLLQATRLQPENLDRTALALMQREADRLSPEEYQAVRHFTERRRSLPSVAAQQSAAMQIAAPLMQRLNIIPPTGTQQVDYADVLEYLAVAYEIARRPK